MTVARLLIDTGAARDYKDARQLITGRRVSLSKVFVYHREERFVRSPREQIEPDDRMLIVRNRVYRPGHDGIWHLDVHGWD